jgi:hypothetical protein
LWSQHTHSRRSPCRTVTSSSWVMTAANTWTPWQERAPYHSLSPSFAPVSYGQADRWMIVAAPLPNPPNLSICKIVTVWLILVVQPD